MPNDKKWGMFGVNFTNKKLQYFSKTYKIDVKTLQGRCTDLKTKSNKTKIKCKKKNSTKSTKSKSKRKSKNKSKTRTKKKQQSISPITTMSNFKTMETNSMNSINSINSFGMNSFEEDSTYFNFQSQMPELTLNNELEFKHFDHKTRKIKGDAYLSYFIATADITKETYKLVIVAPHVEAYSVVSNDMESTIQFYFKSNLAHRMDQVKWIVVLSCCVHN